MSLVDWRQPVDEHSTVTAEEFVEAARRYLGTPYRPQGRSLKGVDCGNLVTAAGRDLKIADVKVGGYSNSPDGIMFEALLNMGMVEVPKESTRFGDVVACDYGEGIQHVGIVTSTGARLTVIHAKRGKGVIEQGLSGRHIRAWTKTYRLKHLA